ncbi:GNAT family N-acetyltransferase [Billgrantia sp. Q4P2]|uniref:GNAT family N-acetyltransferase n=1 Tax=Billgrantia sp. Q4P2 TaxID=3463857 RepID=UPI0040567782
MVEGKRLMLDDTSFQELAAICEMEQGETLEFIVPYSLEKHQEEFSKPNVVYKTIRQGKDLVGFVILALDPDDVSIELRRIVVSNPGRGIGACTLEIVRDLCGCEYGRSRVWLDVFETNSHARYVYEKAGYSCFGKSEHEGRTLLLYEILT